MERLLAKNYSSPIFIVGMPRSGTKLIREILNRNDDVFIPHSESIFIPFLVKKYGLNPDFRLMSNQKKVINDFKKSTYFHNMSITDTQLDNEHLIEVLRSNCWATIFQYVLNDLVRANNKNIFFGDKTPSYINHLGLISDIYPEVKIIHIIRDPRDQALSSRRAWGKNLYRSAQSWRNTILRCRNTIKRKKIKYLEIRYEDITRLQEVTIRKVCDFLNINYSDRMLFFDKPVENLGSAKDLYIEKHNSNKYLFSLNRGEIKKIEQLTIDVLLLLDYKTVHSIQSLKKLRPIEYSYYRMLDIYNIIKFQIIDKGLFQGLRYTYYQNKQEIKISSLDV